MVRYRQNFAKPILADYSEKIQVYLPGASSKSASYDKYRDVGYTKATQNYLTVNAFVRPVVSNELIVKQIGITSIGAIKIVIKNNDVNLFKLASRIVYKNDEFYVYNDGVGKKMMMVELDGNYTEITLWKKEV
jgi:hypothetical protein